MGLVIFVALAVYLIVLIAGTWLAYRWAAKRGLPRGMRWLATAGGFLLVYLPVFWDHIPTIVAHKYYCEKEAGFWVYKTVDQWKAENPGVADTLTSARVSPSKRIGDMKNYTNITFLNQRLNWVVKKNGPFLINRWRNEMEVKDIKTGDVLARYIDFSTGYGELALGGDDWRIVKFWLADEHCTNGKYNRGKIFQFESQVEALSKEEKR